MCRELSPIQRELASEKPIHFMLGEVNTSNMQSWHNLKIHTTMFWHIMYLFSCAHSY